VKSFRDQVIRFWDVFTKEELHLRAMLDDEANTHDQLQHKTKQILDICMSECDFTIEKNDEGRYVLTLSPQRDALFILYLRYVIDKAPKALTKHWDFYYSKQKKNDADFTIQWKDRCFSYRDVIVYPRIHDQHFILSVYIDYFQEFRRDERSDIVYQLLTACIGEIYTMYLIESIKFLKRKKPGGMTLDQLPDYIEEVIQTQHWLNVNDPLQVYSPYTILPRKNEFHLRDDIYRGVSSQLKLINEMVHYDDTHVRWAEANGIIIGFVFYEHVSIDKKEQLVLRESLEEKLSHACEEKQIAENIGVAGGIFYTYLDYVVYDWEMFLAILPEFMDDVNTRMYGFQYMVSGEQPLYVVNNKISGQS